MQTKVEMLRCDECGHTLTRESFEAICFADCYSKDHYIGLIGDGKCPECGEEALEEYQTPLKHASFVGAVRRSDA